MTNPADDQPNFQKDSGQPAAQPHPQQQPYSEQQPVGGQPYPGQPYAGQPYPGQPYPGQPYPGQPYPAGAGYGPPGIGADPSAPWGRHPLTGQAYSEKSKLVAGLLQFFLGCFGIGRFYTGHTGIAIAQLFTCGGLGIWALVDSILMLVGKVTDAQGRPLRD